MGKRRASGDDEESGKTGDPDPRKPEAPDGAGEAAGTEAPQGSEAPGDPPGGTLARRMALEAILEGDGGRRAFLQETLERRLASESLEERDRHLLQEISYGTIRHRNTLDHLIESFIRLPMKRQRPPVRWALRLAAYQLVYLSRIPPHAAIDRTIDALKGLPGAGLREAGFLNAVLRRLAGDILRKSEGPPLDADDPTVLPIRAGTCHFRRPVLPLRNIDPVGHLALKHSHPPWLVARWLKRFGEEEAAAILAAGNRTPAVAARITSRAPSLQAVLESLAAQGVRAAPWEAEGAAAGPVSVPALGPDRSVVLGRAADPGKLEAVRTGWIQVQDPAATAIGRALSPPAGARVLDLCAAPGGKAAQLLEAVGPTGSLVACDVEDEKLDRLRENLERTGGSFEIRKVSDDPAAIELGERFAYVLLDAPCSNTGVLARRPEARWRIHREDLALLAARQRALLEAAVRHLAPGGRLVYATCSIEPEEDEEVAAAAVLAHPELVKVGEKVFLPTDRSDGGYYAVMERG